MTKPLIRLAAPKDAKRIGDIFVASRAAALPFLIEAHSPDEMRRWIAQVVLPQGSTWVACEEEKIVGFLTLNDDKIEHLYLTPDHTQQGVGTALMEHAKARSPDHLSLCCLAENHPARRFYETHGFYA
ncbi:MAG: GNAT family N-acetyltransferase [Pseudomonadota bacterium]